jgi:hypothetical protein
VLKCGVAAELAAVVVVQLQLMAMPVVAAVEVLANIELTQQSLLFLEKNIGCRLRILLLAVMVAQMMELMENSILLVIGAILFHTILLCTQFHLQ